MPNSISIKIRTVALDAIVPHGLIIPAPSPETLNALEYEEDISDYVDLVVTSGVLFDFELVGDGVEYDLEPIPKPECNDIAEEQIFHKLCVISQVMAPNATSTRRLALIRQFVSGLRSLSES
jgi:hypothetical protein